MTITLEQMRQQFPNCNYAPRVGCRFCNGTGIKATRISLDRTVQSPCICIYVDHEVCDFAAEGLAATARKIKAEEIDGVVNRAQKLMDSLSKLGQAGQRRN